MARRRPPGYSATFDRAFEALDGISVVAMPTALRLGPYRFFFYASDAPEPPHIHVRRDDQEAKLWLDPVAVARNRGFLRTS